MNSGDTLLNSAKFAVIPDYEDRPQQVQVQNAVADALAHQSPLLIEAGTGTGKTLAYLLPALVSGKRIVVSTATRALQEQIAERDVPLAGKILGIEPNLVVLKGVQNYLCRRRWHNYSVLPGLDDWGELRDDLRAWQTTTTTGDRAEFTAISPNHRIWAEITTDSEGRLGPSCPFHSACFVTGQRKRAETAQIVVVNHHLFLADLSLREHSGQGLLPEYAAVVFDEAHQLEDHIAAHFGVSASAARLRSLCRDTLGLLNHRDIDRAVTWVEQAAIRFFHEVRTACLSFPHDDTRRIPFPHEGLASRVDEPWLALDTALESLSEAALALAGLRDPNIDPRARLAARVGRARDDIATLVEQRDRSRVFWAEVSGRDVTLRGALIDASQVLARSLFPTTPGVIFTSATLSLAGDFAFTRRGFGLSADDATELSVPSPFNYAEQAQLYLPRDLPSPVESGFTSACHARIRELCDITAGRALVLFTSHRALDEARRELPKLLPYPVLAQGEAPPGALLDRFRSTPSVLLATGAFWEGVDIPGPALSLLIIEKIPFASPTDPLVKARMEALEEAGQDPFATYQLPQAGLALKQGFGRLIRRQTDRGIAAILDVRLLSKQYGRVLIGTLPPDLPRTASLEQLRRFWAAA